LVTFSLQHLVSPSKSSFVPGLRKLEEYLSYRTFFVGYNITLADIIIFGNLKINNDWNTFDKSTVPHLQRWFMHFEQLGVCKAVSGIAKQKPSPKSSQPVAAGTGKKSKDSGKIPSTSEPLIEVVSSSNLLLNIPNPCNNRKLKETDVLPTVCFS
jgi:glutamyl-tRNA synthetase